MGCVSCGHDAVSVYVLLYLCTLIAAQPAAMAIEIVNINLMSSNTRAVLAVAVPHDGNPHTASAILQLSVVCEDVEFDTLKCNWACPGVTCLNSLPCPQNPERYRCDIGLHHDRGCGSLTILCRQSGNRGSHRRSSVEGSDNHHNTACGGPHLYRECRIRV